MRFVLEAAYILYYHPFSTAVFMRQESMHGITCQSYTLGRQITILSVILLQVRQVVSLSYTQQCSSSHVIIK